MRGSDKHEHVMPGSEDTLAFLKEHAPFDRMKPEHLAFLAEHLRPIRFSDGDIVTNPEAGPAEWFYVLQDGILWIDDQGAGNGTRVEGTYELSPGECFPIGALVDNRPVLQIQRAGSPVVCLTMNRALFNELREISQVFGEFCTSRLTGLIEKSNRNVQARKARDLGDDSSLNVRLSSKKLNVPQTVIPDTPIVDVLRAMSAARIGSMVIVDAENRPVGIFTLKDLMNRVALAGRSYDEPISTVMSPDPIHVPGSTFAFEAAMVMAQAGIQHLLVVDDGLAVGIVSERDLFSMQRVGLVNLSKSISRATTIDEVAKCSGDIHLLVAQMIAQGVKVGQVTQIISLLNDRIAVRVIELTLEQHGPAPAPFTWLAFGSEGRLEQTLKTDQDNGILFEVPDGADVEDVRTRLMALADRINTALDICGFPLCTGGIMARNPDCCRTADEWQARFLQWIDQGTPEHLLKATIFFDFRTIWGPAEPVDGLRSWLLEQTAKNSRFLRQMAGNALTNTPPLGLLRDFRLSGEGDQANTIDLKINGVAPFIDAARILSLAHGVGATNTVERLKQAAGHTKSGEPEVAAWVDAYDYIRLLRMRLNEYQATEGRELTNRISPNWLNELDRRILKEAFREARKLQSKLTLDYQL